MKLKSRELIICGLCASITAILAQVSIPIPFTTVPLTMQVFAVVLCGLLLGPRLGCISQMVYILMGAIGMPVFAQMSGGMPILMGPTGGFLLSFPLLSLIVGYFSRKYNSKIVVLLGMLVALNCSYLIGTLQFTIIMKVGFMQGLVLCVLPFIPVDILKLSIAYIVSLSISKRINLDIIRY